MTPPEQGPSSWPGRPSRTGAATAAQNRAAAEVKAFRRPGRPPPPPDLPGAPDMAAARPRPSALGGKRGRAAEGRAMGAAEGEERLLLTQRLKAAVHYTVGCLCQDAAEDKDIQFSKQTIAAISEITFRQCENFAKDLEMFARHAKRSTVTTEDVKLLARRSNSLLKYITQKSEEITASNMEQKEKKKKSSAAKGGRTSGEKEAAVTESEDSNMA